MTDTKPEPNFIHSRGMKFPDDPTILRGRVRKLLRQNAYEAKESEAALRVVREGDRVIELGGGVGYMSTLAASSGVSVNPGQSALTVILRVAVSAASERTRPTTPCFAAQ